MLKKLIIRLLLLAFFFTSAGPLPNTFAQTMMNLPAPGTQVLFSAKFNQATLKGIIFHPQNPFKFDFILDEGDISLNQQELIKQTQIIASYFLASLTTPEKEIWVNLSPYEKDRIIPRLFGQTVMGQNLLAQDYMLKQIMATALYPERQLGREFWKKVYTQALIKYGTTNIPIDTFNKVWIVPDKAVVYENPRTNAVFVADSSLKVMLEQDYLAAYRHKTPPVLESVAGTMSAAVIKELVIPALEKEVNEGKNFAPLRQVYNALILAKWYKENLKNNIIAQGYVDRNKVKGVDSRDKQRVNEIYRLYLKAYKKGVFNYIKDDFDEGSQSIVPRKYFSGGFMGAVHLTKSSRAMTAKNFGKTLIASIILTFASSSGQQVFNAAGTPPVQYENSMPNEQEALKIIAAAVNGKGDPQAAAEAFGQIHDAGAAGYAAGILRQGPRADFDKPLKNMLSNSSGPGFTAGVGGGFSAPFEITALGIGQELNEFRKKWREELNAGNITLRIAAANYLIRVADQLDRAGFWEKITNKGFYESLSIKNVQNPMEKAVRLLAQSVLIKLKKNDTEMWGRAIRNLDEAVEILKKPVTNDWYLHMAALSVFDAISPGDLDNRYQDYIGTFVAQVPTDIDLYQGMVELAIKHGIPVTPSVVQNIGIIYNTRPPVTDLVALRNWHERLGVLIQLMIKLSNGNKDLLTANMKALSNHLTAFGSTDTLNSFYLGVFFSGVQSGIWPKADYIDQINQFRTRMGLSAIPAEDVQIGDASHDPGYYIAQLMDGINVPLNVRRIVYFGGPLYYQDLLQIFKETNDPRTAQAILNEVYGILCTGVYPQNNNPWLRAIDEKSLHPNSTISLSAARFMLTHRFTGMAVAQAFADNDLLKVTTILQTMLSSGIPTKNYVPAIVHFVFSQRNPLLDNTETGQTPVFKNLIALAAKVIVASKIEDSELAVLIANSTPTDETGALTGRLLKDTITAIKEGRFPQTTAGEGDQWVRAEREFLDYLHGSPLEPKIVARHLEAAYHSYKRPSDPNSGFMITQRFMDMYVANPMYRNTSYMIKMADVFAEFEDKNWSFELLGGLLNSRVPQVDLKVLGLFKEAAPDQIATKADAIIDMYLFWFNNREKLKLANPDSIRIAADIEQAVRALGDPLGEAIQNRIPKVSDPERRALLGLGISQTALTTLDPPAAPYAQAISNILNPQVGGDQLLGTLNSLVGTQFPSTALDDLIDALRLSKFNSNTNYMVPLIKVIEAAQNQLGETIVSGDTYQKMKEVYLEVFKNAPDPKTQVAVLRLFRSTPRHIAAELFWDGLNALQQDPKYEGYAGDSNKLENYFGVLIKMEQVIKYLQANDPDKYKAIVDHMRSNLEAKSTGERFNCGFAYIFLQSIDPQLVAGIDFGIERVPDNHLMTAPHQPVVTTLIGEKEILSTYGLLADRLRTIRAQVTQNETNNPPNPDDLVNLEKLFDSSYPNGQEAAISHFGATTLLFQNDLRFNGPDARMALLLHCDQYLIHTDNSRVSTPDTNGYSDQEMILTVDEFTKRGPKGWKEALHILQDANFSANYPGAANELVYEIGQKGGVDLVQPLLKFYVANLNNYSVFGVGINASYLGSTVEGALAQMRRRDKDGVNSRIEIFINDLPITFYNKTVLKPLLRNLIPAPDNKAMAAKGGIDLGNINLQSQGVLGTKTAFDDPAQLAVLLRSEGLVPVVENIRPLTPSAINQFLGSA